MSNSSSSTAKLKSQTSARHMSFRGSTSHRQSTSSISSRMKFSKRSKKGSSGVGGSSHHHSSSKHHGFAVIDPLDSRVRNPQPLASSKHTTGGDGNQNTTNKSLGSGTSGRASPTMSEVSEALSVSISSSFRVDSMTEKQYRKAMGSSSAISSSAYDRSGRGGSFSSRTGISTPSTYASEEEFLFQSPAAGFQDDSSVSIGETLSVGAPEDDLTAGETHDVDGVHHSSKIDERADRQLSERELSTLLDQEFVINLTETETIFFFEREDESVATDSPHIESIVQRNKQYEELKQKKENSKDNYQNRDMQTISAFCKNKYSDIPRKEVTEQSVSVAAWEIYDQYEALREQEEKEREEQEQITMKQQDDEEEEEEEEDVEEDDDDGRGDTDGSVRSHRSGTSEKASIFKQPRFKESLMIVERLIVQNNMIQKQEEYKDFHDHPDDEVISRTIRASENMSSSKPGELKLLWKYQCDLTKGQNVNCMGWNDKNKDMLAVGYGNIDFIGKKEGGICIWMVKNPTFPERYIPIENRGVSAVSFSKFNPSLLSVGYNDGTVAIFDIRKRDTAPVLETSKHHTGTVWDLQWVDRGKDLGERLHSVGVDGRVNCWSITKGLECQQIMRLKRQGKGEGVLSRESGGMCIDFDPNDSNLYIVGTEDGTIYKCSCSYNEQYLQTFPGHTGPVYRVRWNPYDPHSFLSCSADWTIRVWNDSRRNNPLELKIEPYQNKEEKRSCVITDVAWSPYNKNMFASSSITGDVEIWDIGFNSMKPRFAKSNPEVQYNCLLYANSSPALLVGDNRGSVEVLKTIGLHGGGDAEEE